MKENRFIGFTEKELMLQSENNKRLVEMLKGEIDRLKKEIKAIQREIRYYEKEDKLITAAFDYANNIERVTVLEVTRKEDYFPPAYKKGLAYRFSVQSCNRDDFHKAVKVISSTGIYRTDEKQTLFEDILKAIEEHNVSVIIAEGDVSIAFTKIKKKFPDIQIQRT